MKITIKKEVSVSGSAACWDEEQKTYCQHFSMASDYDCDLFNAYLTKDGRSKYTKCEECKKASDEAMYGQKIVNSHDALLTENNQLRKALEDLFDDRVDVVQHPRDVGIFMCRQCGKIYVDYPGIFCINEDCMAFKGRAVLKRVKGGE